MIPYRPAEVTHTDLFLSSCMAFICILRLPMVPLESFVVGDGVLRVWSQS